MHPTYPLCVVRMSHCFKSYTQPWQKWSRHLHLWQITFLHLNAENLRAVAEDILKWNCNALKQMNSKGGCWNIAATEKIHRISDLWVPLLHPVRICYDSTPVLCPNGYHCPHINVTGFSSAFSDGFKHFYKWYFGTIEMEIYIHTRMFCIKI